MELVFFLDEKMEFFFFPVKYTHQNKHLSSEQVGSESARTEWGTVTERAGCSAGQCPGERRDGGRPPRRFVPRPRADRPVTRRSYPSGRPATRCPAVDVGVVTYSHGMFLQLGARRQAKLIDQSVLDR